MPGTAFSIGAVLLTAVGAAEAGCRSNHDPATLPRASCGSATIS
jgi:hypothetical protein